MLGAARAGSLRVNGKEVGVNLTGFHRWRRVCRAMLIGLACLQGVACVNSAHRSASATRTTGPFPTRTVAPATSATSSAIATQAFDGLSIPPSSNLVPSPNGTLLAAMGQTQTTMGIYDLQGNVQGTYAATDGQSLNVRWLPDSSGLLVWETSGTTNASGPLVVLSAQGQVLVRGWNGWDPAVSPDGAWVAFTHIAATFPGDVEVAPLHGGAARALSNGTFLGWQQGKVIYWLQGAIYSVAPDGSGQQLLTSTPGGEQIVPPLPGPDSSPDGQALLVDEPHSRPAVLAGTHLQAMPFAAVDLEPMAWLGPHDILCGPATGMRIVDIITGAVVRDTGVSISGAVEAVSGAWIASVDPTADQAIFLTNYMNKATRALGPAPIMGPILSLGQGKFVLFGYSASYLIE